MLDSKTLQPFLDSLPDGVLLCDGEGFIVECNASVRDLLGHAPAELRGRSVEVLIPPALRRDHAAHRQRFMRAPEQRTMNAQRNMQTLCRDGTLREVAVALSPVQLGAECVILVSMRAADSIAQARVGDEQAWEKLVKAQRLESLGMLSCGIAHDFRNLLTVVLGNAERLLAGIPSQDPLRQNVRAIESSAAQLSDLSRQILVYANGRQSERQAVNLSAAAEEVLALLHPSCGARMRIDRRLVPGEVSVLGERSQIMQMLLNLIVNATEALGAAGGVVTVSTGSMDAGVAALMAHDPTLPAAARYVYLEVADTGCGIDADTVRRLGAPFFTTKPGGQGLGLAVVKRTANAHGGRLLVSSRPGEGSVFTVLLPAA